MNVWVLAPLLVTVSVSVSGVPGASTAFNWLLLSSNVAPLALGTLAGALYDSAASTALYASISPAPCWSAGALMSSAVLVMICLTTAGLGEASP